MGHPSVVILRRIQALDVWATRPECIRHCMLSLQWKRVYQITFGVLKNWWHYWTGKHLRQRHE